MTESRRITGKAAPLDIENLDTDQIMPKQFLRGIDKAGLADGLLWDLRFDEQGHRRPGFVLNRPAHAGVSVLIAGSNFGCGSSREHAVWGLMQYGIQAVIAPSFGEIFYSNAMNNGLLAAAVSPEEGARLMAAAREASEPLQVDIDLAALVIRCDGVGQDVHFHLSGRHRRMFLEGLDMVGSSLARRADIEAFAARHWESQPWLRDVAQRTMRRLNGAASST